MRRIKQLLILIFSVSIIGGIVFAETKIDQKLIGIEILKAFISPDSIKIGTLKTIWKVRGHQKWYDPVQDFRYSYTVEADYVLRKGLPWLPFDEEAPYYTGIEVTAEGIHLFSPSAYINGQFIAGKVKNFSALGAKKPTYPVIPQELLNMYPIEFPKLKYSTYPVTSAVLFQKCRRLMKQRWLASLERTIEDIVSFYISFGQIDPRADEPDNVVFDYPNGGPFKILKEKLDRRVDFSETFEWREDDGDDGHKKVKVELIFEFECECQPEFGSKDLTGGVVTDFLDGRREKPAPPSIIGKLEAILREEAAARGYKFLSLIFGLRDRGMIREGFHADIVVFDPETIKDTATFFESHQYGKGIEFVIVNGTFVVDKGDLTWKRPGLVTTR